MSKKKFNTDLTDDDFTDEELAIMYGIEKNDTTCANMDDYEDDNRFDIMREVSKN